MVSRDLVPMPGRCAVGRRMGKPLQIAVDNVPSTRRSVPEPTEPPPYIKEAYRLWDLKQGASESARGVRSAPASQHIFALSASSQMWPGQPRTDGPNHIGMPPQIIQRPSGSTGSLIGTRILTRGSRATADAVSMAIAINPIDKSL